MTESQQPEHVFVPELAPSPLWGISASSQLGNVNQDWPDRLGTGSLSGAKSAEHTHQLKRTAWIRIRKDVMEACDCNCEVCGTHVEGGKNMPCDEVCEYVEKPDGNVALLERVRMICRPCDLAHHFGKAGTIGY